ncbi:LptF/LptG family permease [Blastopirellula sp. JC733]|nr:LptF/LptG family permease [Blastopirellula sediminis]
MVPAVCIIDRYLLVQFIKSFLIFFISFTGLYVVIDSFNNLDEFLRYGEQTGRGAFPILIEYYTPRIFTFFNMTGGILTLIAAMFTVTWLQRHNEMTALMAAGITKERIVRPVIIAVAFIAVLGALNREFVVPEYSDALSRNAQDWLGESAKQLQPKYDNLTDVLISGNHTFANEMRIEAPKFRLPRSQPGVGTKLNADNAFYKPAEGDRPSGYLLDNVTEPENLAEVSSLFDRDDNVFVMMPKDYSWLAPNQCFVISELTFEQLTASREWRNSASTWALVSALRNRSLDFGADVRVEIHSRLTQPFLDMTLLLLGLPLVLKNDNRNVFVAIGLCGVVVILFFGVTMASRGMGANYMISPALAAWFPLMIFVPFATYMSESMRA